MTISCSLLSFGCERALLGSRLKFHLALLVILLSLISAGCKKEKDIFPPEEFYEFEHRAGDGTIYLRWQFPMGEHDQYGVEVTYYLNGIKTIKKVFGQSTMTIPFLNNGVTYEFIVVGYDKAGNKNKGKRFSAIPNTPFVVDSYGYVLEGGKLRIDLRFNRPADTNSIGGDWMYGFIRLSTGSGYLPYTYTWLEEGSILSILTTNTKESFCTNSPCTLNLNFHYVWRGAMSYYGISDRNGMQLDADKDGFEMGDSNLTFILN